MRKSFQSAVIAAFGLFMFGASICSAQTMVGGFQDAARTDKSVVSAANFAVAAQNKKQKTASLTLVSVEKAEKQIVAGVNYRLCLAVKSNNKSAQATAIVYQNLQNQYQLTSWTSGNCAGDKKNAPSTVNSVAPDEVVKNLYAADKAEKSPFFQAKNRALVDKYFTKDLADLIWKDAVDSKAGGGVGRLDFAPLYHAQDVRIAAFKIGKAEYGEGNAQLADVPVTFKNMGQAETVLFRLLQDESKVWKISEIYYPKADANANSLKVILSQ